jgi:lysophospholipase L1-like esterase
MKKIIIYLILSTCLTFFITCGLEDPTQPTVEGITSNQLVLLKMVAIGNSLTAGVQSAGLAHDFQVNSYPNLIARQMNPGNVFEQPLIDDPGLSNTPGVGVLDFVNGEIVPRGTYTNPMALLLNALLPRPYDNLGIPGANVNEILNATSSANGPTMTDLILRNPNFANTTVWEQAKLLNPTLILLWVGNNDVLGAATSGGDMDQLAPTAQFQSDLVTLLTELAKIRDGNIGIIMANIFDVCDIAHVNLLDNLIYKTITLPNVGQVYLPVIFDNQFQPVDFDTTTGGELYLPLLTEEGILAGGSPVEHLLLPFLGEYSENGLGVPDSAALVPLLVGSGIPPQMAPGMAKQLELAMQAAGLKTSGIPIPVSLTLTAAETGTIQTRVDELNQVLQGITSQQGIPLVDANNLLQQLNSPSGYQGYSGKFVFFDPANTAFSLDGIHPNNGGYALIANAFIEKMNLFPDIDITPLDPAQFKGQYVGSQMNKISLEAANQVKALFSRSKK